MSISRRLLVGAIAATFSVAFLPAMPAAAETSGSPGDDLITVDVGDDVAGGFLELEFAKVYANQTADGTPVYIYAPAAAVQADGSLDSAGVLGLDPTVDPDPGDGIAPCTDDDASDHLITQEQVDSLGDQLAGQIVAVNEAHFGPMDAADPADPASDSLVMLVYNVFDEAYYDCAADSYVAGYFAPDFINSAGMNVIVIDSFDWANRTGSENSLYEGVIAHELEHLLMNYSDPGELSWVDEGLADMAAFLNGYDATGSHLTYHQVFHRETSLTRWGGGLENYGASYTYFQYLWERAGGNGDGTYPPDLVYDDAAGDLLIKLIFEEQADGMQGVQNAIDTFNSETGANLPTAMQLFQDWAAAVYIDDESTDLFDLKAADFGTPDSGNWTISLANEIFFKKRGLYNGATPSARLDNSGRAPSRVALPFSTSYEEFSRRIGAEVSFEFSGTESSQIAPHTGDQHWYAGYESQADKELYVTGPSITGGETVDFWSWYFIEEGWDYGYVEALVDGDWVTVPVTDASGSVVSTDTNPYGNNDEGNGLTGTSGGTYFVDEPTYVQLSAQLPAGATDVRFRYSTDAAYLDTGWFVDDVTVDGQQATLSSDEWVLTTGEQNNEWAVQILAPCDLTPGVDSDGEQVDGDWHVYQWTGEQVSTGSLQTGCLGKKDHFTLVVSNMPSGDLSFLDAAYSYEVQRIKR